MMIHNNVYESSKKTLIFFFLQNTCRNFKNNYLSICFIPLTETKNPSILPISIDFARRSYYINDIINNLNRLKPVQTLDQT